MRTVQQYREQRRLRQELGNWNVGHFPIGTVVEVESPHNKFVPEADRRHPEEIYGRSVATVSGVTSNGPDSYLIQLVDKCNLSCDVQSTNINWVRAIVSRGTGKLNPDDQAVIDQIRQDRIELFKEKGWGHPYESIHQLASESVPGNCYGIGDLRYFLANYIENHPRYANQKVGEHLIDSHKLYVLVAKNLPEFNVYSYGKVVSVNKKRFARIVKAAYARAKVRRRVMQAINRRLDEEHYEREFAFDNDF